MSPPWKISDFGQNVFLTEQKNRQKLDKMDYFQLMVQSFDRSRLVIIGWKQSIY